MRNKQLLALGLGVAPFSYLIYETGPASLAANLKLIGPKIVFIFALERIVDLFNTDGWWYTFAPNLRRGTHGILCLVRLAGTALNEMMPSASIGGEPAKVILLRPYLPTTAATASVPFLKAGFPKSIARQVRSMSRSRSSTGRGQAISRDRSQHICSHSRSEYCRCRFCSDGSACRTTGRPVSRSRHSRGWSGS